MLLPLMAAVQMPTKHGIDFLRQIAVVHAAEIFDGCRTLLHIQASTSETCTV